MPTTFSGASLSLSVKFNDAPGLLVSSQLEGFTTPFVITPRAGKLVTVAGSTATSTVRIGGRVVTGAVQPEKGTGLVLGTPGDARFDRIHVTIAGSAFGVPNLRALGTLLSEVPVAIEVWSAYRLLSQTLNSIDVTGPSGVTVTTTDVLPLTFAPLRSRFYTATVGIVGGPTIDNAIHWDFAGISEPLGLLTGTRLVPFPFQPDWGDDLVESYEWRTAVMAANNGNEQRVKLRTYPRKFLAYTAKTFTVQEAAYMESLMYGWQDQKFGVPAWHEAMRLSVAATAGANTLTVADNADRDLHTGQVILLWQDPFTWEAKVVLGIAGSVLTLIDTVSSAWPARTTFVLPMWSGSLQSIPMIDRPARDAGIAQVLFQLEARVV